MNNKYQKILRALDCEDNFMLEKLVITDLLENVIDNHILYEDDTIDAICDEYLYLVRKTENLIDEEQWINFIKDYKEANDVYLINLVSFRELGELFLKSGGIYANI